MYNKIQFKIIALVSLITVFFILGLLSLRNSESKNISMLLKDRVSEKDTILSKIINLKSKPLLSYVYDYSYWDEMITFTKTINEKWAYENIIVPLNTFNVNAVWIYNPNFELIYTTNNLNDRTFKELQLSKEDFKSIVALNPFAHFFINTSLGLMEISMAPLQPGYDNNRVTPPQGYYIGGRLWTKEYLNDLSTLTSSRIFLVPNSNDSIKNNDIRAFEFINDIELHDWNGSKLITLRAKTESPVIEKFFTFSNYQFIGTVVFIALVIVLISMYLFKIVNTPLNALTQSLETGNIKHINYLLKKKNEFGDIANLIANSFKYEESLLEEIAMRKKAEEEVRKAKEKAEELSKLKSNLLANLSHEFRTPLSGIIGISELLKDEIPNPEHYKLLNDISISGRRLHETLNSILLLGQFESSEITLYKETFNFADEIELYINKFKYKTDDKNLELKFIPGDRTVLLNTDKDLLRQIFFNIFDNAVKFTDKGSITIELKSQQENDALYAFLEITDTGIGISENNIGIIFDEFKQISEGYGRKYEGSGLGLTLTKKVLNVIDGSITCKSEPGVGSTFIVKIPALKINLEQKTTVVKIKKGKSSDKKLPKILFVEDNLSNQFVFDKFLTDTANVEFAENGIDALKIIDKHKFDIIFMDINLGSGMDGIETMKEIKKNEKYLNTPFIALTGYAMEHDRDYFLSQGFNYFMVKPFGKNDLITVVNQILRADKS